ncbi:MAG TPA: hypothetical protein VGB17_05590 [Pyrinomonadaceae bacterium]|jgi:antitoxin component of MazEF toxin-antitoxin module
MKLTATRQSKVTNDNGVIRSKVPAPILNALGAKAGDYLTFELDGARRAVMKVSKKKAKTAKQGRK